MTTTNDTPHFIIQCQFCSTIFWHQHFITYTDTDWLYIARLLQEYKMLLYTYSTGNSKRGHDKQLAKNFNFRLFSRASDCKNLQLFHLTLLSYNCSASSPLPPACR